MQIEWIQALLGGIIIGAAVSLMLFWNGRVTGISGIVGGVLDSPKGDAGWRYLFITGMLLGGLALKMISPQVFDGHVSTAPLATITAGLLVGIGTTMGSGCTSGHGVCGISRMSPRSLAATLTFISAGIIAVLLFKRMGVLP
jgi:uncharacterized protein